MAAAGLGLAVFGCGGHGSTGAAKSPAAAQGAAGGGCAIRSAMEPVGRTGAGATVALAKIGGRKVALVADEDTKAIVTVDVDTRAQLAETPLGGVPAQIYVARDGRVLATLRDKHQVIVLGATRADAPLVKGCSGATPVEPIAIAATPDESTVLVTAGWGQALVALDAATLAPRFVQRLPREPRAVVVSDDGKTAFVSHAVGSVTSTVDLVGPAHAVKTVSTRGFDARQAAGAERLRKQMAAFAKMNPSFADGSVKELERLEKGRPSCQGFALAKSSAVPGRVLAPEVIVDPGDPERRPDGYGDTNAPTEAAAVAVIDEAAGEVMRASVTRGQELPWLRGRRDARDDTPECLLPRAAAVDGKSKTLLVACYGIDAVVAYDAQSAEPVSSERRRWIVGSGPSGVAIDEADRRAVVWSQFDRSVSTFSIADMGLVDEKTAPARVAKTLLPAAREKLPAEVALGRIIFHGAGDPRVAADGRACASCHPDGRDDGITWATPEGPRRSILLSGRVSATAPYAWDGKGSTLHNHLGNTFDRLSGKGLRSIELDALVAYISQLPAPGSGPLDASKLDRGRQIFASREAACASCHAGAMFTDGQNHDVGSRHKADRTASFNTPSLKGVGATGPYFHDGRYATLGELLRKSDGTMGRTKHLSDADLDALETFLRSL